MSPTSRRADEDPELRLRAVFLAESRRLLPDVGWRESEPGELVHARGALRVLVTFEPDRITVHHRPGEEHWHFDAFDPAPEIPPDELAESAARALERVRALLARGGPAAT